MIETNGVNLLIRKVKRKGRIISAAQRPEGEKCAFDTDIYDSRSAARYPVAYR